MEHQETEKPVFTGDQKELDHFLLAYERPLLDYLVPKVPQWIETTHLTLMTALWSAGVVLCGYKAAGNILWLWGFSACIVLQHISDMLDGAIGRARNTGLIKWGFYMDHFLDYMFMSSIVIGYSFLLPKSYEVWVLACLALTGGFMVHTFLDFGITNKFKISVNRFGVSEIRYVLIVFNVALMVFGKELLFQVFPFVVGGFAVALAALVYASQKAYGETDMDVKAQAEPRRSKRGKFLTRKPMPAHAILAVALALAALAGPGPGAYAALDNAQTTTTTHTADGDETTVTTTQQTNTQTPPIVVTKKEENHSLVGSFFVFVGNVVAFPFRLIGSMFDAIF